MSKFSILTDSSCDLPKNLIDNLSIQYLGLICNLNNTDYIEDCGVSLKYSNFYNQIRSGVLPITSQINSFRFAEVFEEHAKKNTPLLYIGFSSALSGTFNSAVIAKNDVIEKYPNAKIILIDSKSASLGVGALVIDACKLRDKDFDIESVANYIENEKLKINHIFTVDDLNHLKRGGRISKTSATFGTLLNIKPILRVSEEGSLVDYAKVKGRKKSIKTIFEEFKEKVVNPENQTVFISHADCLEDAKILSNMIKDEFSTEVMINYIGLAIGSHTGANALTIIFKGNDRKLN